MRTARICQVVLGSSLLLGTIPPLNAASIAVVPPPAATPSSTGATSAATTSATSVITPTVVPGCPAPAAVAGHHTYYVDPQHGSMSGDGSAARPWHTLQEVLDVRSRLVANAPTVFVAGMGFLKPNPNAPIKSGDTLYLMTGVHGSILLQGNFGGSSTQLSGYNNNDFVTIAAARGQTPVITQLALKGVNKYLFQGITFQSLQNVPGNQGRPFSGTSAGTNDYFLIAMVGPNSNVIFNQDHVLSQADTSTWTPLDWLSKRASGIVAIGGNCFSITNNNIENIGFAIGSQRGTNVLIAHNTIDTFVDDGIDYGSSNMIIDGNTITNSIEDQDGFHRDGMQGQPYGTIPISNIRITNNVVINQTKPLVSPAYLQGIDAFDGVLQNLTIANNIVVTNSYHGMTFAGATNISVVNNTVIGTNSGLGGVTTWIDISPSKLGTASSGITVRNNIATFFAITGVSANVDHNIIATTNPNFMKYFRSSAGVSAAVSPLSVFNAFNSTNFIYDMRLRSGPTVGAGALALAPPTDIRGLVRGIKIDLGAVKYGGPPLSTALK